MTSEPRFKVVTMPGGVTANKFGDKAPIGTADKNAAELDAAARSKRAKEMGLETRYEVAQV